jgi:DNA-binding CsgD family transcriptional regulator
VHVSKTASRVADAVTAIGSSGGPVAERATAVLSAVQRLIPFEAGLLQILDTDQQQFEPISQHGYNQATADYRRGRDYREEIEALGLLSAGQAVCGCDLPRPLAEIAIWADHLEPAGFRQGVAAPLFTSDGRYVGVYAAHSDQHRHVGHDAMTALGQLAPIIADSVDPLNSISTLARMVTHATAGVVLTRAGDCLPLPGFATDPSLCAGADVVTTAALLLDEGSQVTFLRAEPDGYSRITVLACPPDVPRHLQAVVLLGPIDDVSGLSSRELEILGLLVEGWPNRRIATVLALNARALTGHLERILAKLAVTSRTLAAVRALRLGLYIPRPLNGVPR